MGEDERGFCSRCDKQLPYALRHAIGVECDRCFNESLETILSNDRTRDRTSDRVRTVSGEHRCGSCGVMVLGDGWCAACNYQERVENDHG